MLPQPRLSLPTAVLGLILLAFTAAAQEPPPAVPESEVGVNAMILIGAPTGMPLSGAALDARTHEVASVMRCPICQGLSVADSQAKTAVAMKGEVKDLLAEGYTEEQVLQYFEQAYGEFVLLEPKAEGFNLLVWFAPGVAVLIGLVVVVVRLRKTAPPEAAPSSEEGEADAAAPATAADPELEEYLRRVRSEVDA